MTKENRNATHTYQKTDKGDFEIGTMRSFNNVATLREVSLTQKTKVPKNLEVKDCCKSSTMKAIFWFVLFFVATRDQYY